MTQTVPTTFDNKFYSLTQNRNYRNKQQSFVNDYSQTYDNKNTATNINTNFKTTDNINNIDDSMKSFLKNLMKKY